MPSRSRTIARLAGAFALAVLFASLAADANARPLNKPGQVWVPGHYSWDARQRQYVWVPSHWERNRMGRESVGIGWTFRNGRWQFTP